MLNFRRTVHGVVAILPPQANGAEGNLEQCSEVRY